MNNRNFGLDLLRSLAILFVLYEHGLPILRPALSPSTYEFLKLFIFDGVSFFFVLSGFLIGRILFREFTETQNLMRSLGKFWINRWMRTLPAYLVVLIFLVLIERRFTWETFEYFFFIQNLTGPHPTFFPEAWSLAVEEWFYLSSPLIFIFYLKTHFKPRHAFLLTALSLGLFSIALRAYLPSVENETQWDEQIKKVLIFRFDAMMLGFLAAWMFHRPIWDRIQKIWPIGLSLIVIQRVLQWKFNTFYGDWPFYYNNLSLLLVGLGTLLCLPKIYGLSHPRIRYLSQCITYISLISYSLYLLNLSIIRTHIIPRLHNKLLPQLNEYPWLEFTLYLVLCFGLASVLRQLIEKPFIELRDKLKK